MKIFAIDPGYKSSGVVLYDTAALQVLKRGEVQNHDLLAVLRGSAQGADIVVSEMVGHYGTGIATGVETYDTVRWIGRFEEAVEGQGRRFEILLRTPIRLQLCGQTNAKDKNIRQALIDRFGGDSVALDGKRCPCAGKRKSPCPKCGSSGWLRTPGPLAGISGHMWSALAVAVTWAEKNVGGAA